MTERKIMNLPASIRQRLMLTDQALQRPASATLFLRVALGWLHRDDENGESGTEASGTKTSLCNAL